MKALRVATLVAATFALYSPALANCRVTELKLEKAIPPHSELRQSANRESCAICAPFARRRSFWMPRSIRPSVGVSLQYFAICWLTRTARLKRQEILTRTRPRSCTRRVATRPLPTPPSNAIEVENYPRYGSEMTRLLSTLSRVALIAAAGRFLVAAGWITWAALVAVAALALIIGGFRLPPSQNASTTRAADGDLVERGTAGGKIARLREYFDRCAQPRGWICRIEQA